jgi:hypothetical protein
VALRGGLLQVGAGCTVGSNFLRGRGAVLVHGTLPGERRKLEGRLHPTGVVAAAAALRIYEMSLIQLIQSQLLLVVLV